MDKYVGAFRAGIAAANEVHESQREIDTVLREFSNALERATDGRLRVAITESSFLMSAIEDAVIAASAQARPKGKRLSLAAINKVNGKSFEMAGWRQGKSAYPCWLIFRNQDIACTDRASLEVELARLAASPDVGERILEVLK